MEGRGRKAENRSRLPGEMREIQEDVLKVGRLVLTFLGIPLVAVIVLPVILAGEAKPALWVEIVVLLGATGMAWILRDRSFRLQALNMTLPLLIVSIASLAQWGPSFGSGVIQMAVLSILLVFFSSSLGTLILVALAVLVADALLATAMVQGWIQAPAPGYLDASVGGNWVRVLLSSAVAIPVAVYLLFRLFRGATDAWQEAERRFEELSREQVAREEAQRALEQEQKLGIVGRLASGISHDFNNSLTVIMGLSDLLAKRVSTEAERELVEEIERATETAADLSTRLLIFSRGSRKEPRPVDLGQLLPRLQKSLRRLLPPGIHITVRSTTTRPAGVDPAQLEQAILNLCLNARDAMVQGGELTLTAQDSTMGGEEGILLSVQDTGTGMDEETQARIFDPFFTTKPEGKGTGLGLAMVREMVVRHGGTLSVESTLGEGSTFTLGLPAWTEWEMEVVQTDEPAPVTGSILLLDDDMAVRRVLARTLEDAGHRVVSLSTGGEASAILAGGQRFDLLVTDTTPGPTDGPSVVDLFLTSCPSGRVLLVSGHGRDELEERGLLRPEVVLIDKPVSPAALRKRTRELMGDRG